MTHPFMGCGQQLAAPLRPRSRPEGTTRQPRSAPRKCECGPAPTTRSHAARPTQRRDQSAQLCLRALCVARLEMQVGGIDPRRSASSDSALGVSSRARSSSSAAGRGSTASRACSAAPSSRRDCFVRPVDGCSQLPRARLGSSSSSASRAWISRRRSGSAISYAPAASSGWVNRRRSPSISNRRSLERRWEADVALDSRGGLGDCDGRVCVRRCREKERPTLLRKREQTPMDEVAHGESGTGGGWPASTETPLRWSVRAISSAKKGSRPRPGGHPESWPRERDARGVPERRGGVPRHRAGRHRRRRNGRRADICGARRQGLSSLVRREEDTHPLVAQAPRRIRERAGRAVSSHWTSIPATTIGPRSASLRSPVSSATPTARASAGAPTASVSSSTSARERRTAGSREGARGPSRRPSSRSPRPEKLSVVSLSAGRAWRTRCPRASASATPTRQSVVLPIPPASPSSTSADAPSETRDRKPLTDASSASRPTTAVMIGDRTPVRRGELYGRRGLDLRARTRARRRARRREPCRPRRTRPRGARSASGFSTSRWIARFSGRAP